MDTILVIVAILVLVILSSALIVGPKRFVKAIKEGFLEGVQKAKDDVRGNRR